MTAETSNARGEVVAERQAWYEQQIALAEGQWAAAFLDRWEGGDDVPSKEHYVALWLAERAAPQPADARGDVRGLVDGVRRLSERWKSREIDGEPVSESKHMQLAGCAAMLDSLLDNYALAAEGAQAGEVEVRARELLAAEMESSYKSTAARLRDPAFPSDRFPSATQDAIRAIVAALAQQPAAVDEAMVERAWVAFCENNGSARQGIRAALTAALAAQPGGSDNDR